MTGIATIAAVALVTLALNGCGGGGGGTITPAPASYDLQAGYSGLVDRGQSATVTLSGSVIVNGNSVPYTGSGTLTLAAGTSSAFNGTACLAQTETIAGTITAAGQTRSFPTIVVVDYYQTGVVANGSVAFLGETDSSEYDVAQSPIVYPSTVVAGSNAILGTVSRYTDRSMGVSLGTVQISYMATAPVDPGSQVLVALTEKIYDTQNNLMESDVTNFTLTASNVLSFASATVQNAAGSLTVTTP